MKEYETETYTRKYIRQRTCDICDAPAYEPRHHNWTRGVNPNTVKTTVELIESNQYPEGESLEAKIEKDICPDCFKTRLLPWIEAERKKVEAEG